MKALASSVLAVTGLFSFAASACDDAPMIGAIPDGKTATEAQLVAVRNEVTAYMAKMEEYLVCLEDELKAQGGDAAPEKYKEMMATRILAGDDERRRVVEAFNAARQAFREANPN